MKLWEMCEVDNCDCGGAPLDPYHAPVMMPSLLDSTDTVLT